MWTLLALCVGTIQIIIEHCTYPPLLLLLAAVDLLQVLLRMRVIKPAAVKHGQSAVYALDFQPVQASGVRRLATAGGGNAYLG